MTPADPGFVRSSSQRLVGALLAAFLLAAAATPRAAEAQPYVQSAWQPLGGQASAFFGSSVATAGDVNGDGYSDVLVGAPQYDNGQANEGRVYLYYGGAAGLNPVAG
jgi:hypothetical protein